MENERPASIKPTHLERKAVVYIRQSTEEQVLLNTGSTEYQRSQARYPERWGWPPEAIETLEGDLGLSGIAADHRPAYQNMRRETGQDLIGAIFFADLTRGGRDASEWYHFLDLCKMHDVLVVINGRVHDLNNDADMLQMRLLATVGQHENMSRRNSMNQGRLAKAAQGHAVSPPPCGYVRLPDGSWAKDPDHSVRAAIAAVFRELLRHRSCKRTMVALNELGVELPRRQRNGMIRWVKPQVGTIYPMLKNPSYKGEYHYRRQTGDPRAGRDSRGRVRLRPAPPEKTIVSRDHHAPYISASDWDHIQSILKLNGPSKDRRNPGPGSALLQGILRCAIHHLRSLAAIYKKERADGGRFHTYNCMGDYLTGGEQCGWIAGDPLDGAVVEAMFSRLSPPSLAAIRDGMTRARGDACSEQSRRETELRRAQQNAADIEERYLLVDIKNRYVALTLEAKLEEAKRKLKRLERMIASEPSPIMTFDDTAFNELVGLCQDLRALWNAPTTSNLDRKQIIRTMIKEVSVIYRDALTVRAEITWADGAPPTVVETARTRNGHVQKLIAEMAAEGLDPEMIAQRLNEMGILTPHGRPWAPATVARKHRLMLESKGAKSNRNEAA